MEILGPEPFSSHDFTNFLVKQKEVRNDFLDFLDNETLLALSMTSKKIKKVIKLYEKRRNKIFDETTFEGKLSKLIHKTKKKPKKNIFKTSLFNLDYEIMIDPYDWLLLNDTEEENNSLIEDLKGIVPTNMLKDNERYVYYNSELKKYLMVHRSFVDPQFSLFYKNNARGQAFNSVAEDQSNDKVILEEADLDLANFNLDQNSMLERHRLLVQKREKNKIKQKEETDPCNLARNQLKRAIETTHSSVILLKGGDFSIVLKYRDQTIYHRGDHKYVIRKKQGGRQIIKGKGMNSAGGQIRWNNELLHREAIKGVIADEVGVKLKKFLNQGTQAKDMGKLEHNDFIQMKIQQELISNQEQNEQEYDQIKVGRWIRESDWLFVHAPGENKIILFGDQASQLKGGGDGTVLGNKGNNTSDKEKQKHGSTKTAKMLNVQRNDPSKKWLYEGDKDYVGGGFLEDLTTWEGVRSLGKGGMSQGIGKVTYGEAEKIWEEISSVYIIAEEDYCN